MLLGLECKLVMLLATGFSHLGCGIQPLCLAAQHLYCSLTTSFSRFRLLSFRSPLLWASLLLSFLWLLRCFRSPGGLLPTHGFCTQFKSLRYLIYDYFQLGEAFHRLLRP